jgi:hypothetical protein
VAKAAARAATSVATAEVPRRMVFLFVPNGMHMADWTPAQKVPFSYLIFWSH